MQLPVGDEIRSGKRRPTLKRHAATSPTAPFVLSGLLLPVDEEQAQQEKLPCKIIGLEATAASDRRLSIRVRLSGCEAAAAGGRSIGLLSLLFTLATANGRQMGGMEVTIGPRTCDLSVEMSVPESVSVGCQLKACLCVGETVLDTEQITLEG